MAYYQLYSIFGKNCYQCNRQSSNLNLDGVYLDGVKLSELAESAPDGGDHYFMFEPKTGIVTESKL